MSVSQNFPDEGPSLSLNFAGAEKLDPRITFTRSSTGTYLDRSGLVVTAPANSPRFEHSYNGSNVESLGLLIEESRTNLLTYSDYSSGNSANNVTLTTNATTAPDGTNTAISMTGNAGTSVKYLYKQYTTTTTGTYTTSVFAKYNGEQYILLRVNDNTGVNDGQQRFDILNGIKNGNVANGGTATGASSTITPYPNGWYRLTVTCTFNSALTSIQGASVYLTGYTSTSSTNSVYLWAPQLEAGAFPTSYIPTVASTVTRSADNASMTGTNFSSWYNQTEGTILTNIKYDGAPISGVMNRIAFYLRGTGSANTWHGWWESVNTGGTINYNGTSFDATLIQSGTTISQGSRVKLISAIKTNDFAFSQNGGTVQTDTSVILPITHTIIDIGSSGGGNYINGTISQLLYYPKRLTNSQLQNLTK